MSGINCGTYPIPNVANADATIEAQALEYDILSDQYDSLQTSVDAVVANYNDDVDLIDITNAGAVSLYENKPVSYFYETARIFNILTSDEVFFEDYLSGSTGTCSYFYIGFLSFLVPSLDAINGIVFRTYVEDIVVCETTIDVGLFAVNDTTSQIDLQSIFQVPAGTDATTCYMTLQLITDNPTVIVPVQIGSRLSAMSAIFS
jgi:hypothetical protein